MPYKPAIYLFIFLFCQFRALAQDFHPPLNIPLVLSGNFGEIRSNHFHSGLDIKTQGRIGLPVFCITDGTVARVKVSPYGYGKALYINHPNGQTSVYAHLNSFSPEIEAWIEDQQYAQKSYDINTFPPAGKFVFKKGDEIGKSGNSGSSGGPHLHFEIRDTKTERPINPLKYPFKIADNKAPSIYGLSVYALDDKSHVNNTHYANFSMGGSYGNYSLKPGETISAHGNIGFALHTIDRLDAANNKCGVYKVTLSAGNDILYQFEIDELDFSTNRYMNAHIDYRNYKKYRKHYHRLYTVENNPLDIYNIRKRNGALQCIGEGEIPIKITVEDVAGNASTLEFTVQCTAQPSTRIIEANPNQQWVDCKKPFEWKSDIASVAIPSSCLYLSEYMDFKSSTDNNGLPVLTVGDETYGAQKSYTLRLKIPETLMPKANKIHLGKVAANGRAYPDNPGEVHGAWFEAKNREFGTYTLLVDTLNPYIKPLSFYPGKEVRNGNSLRFRIKDSGSGIQEYNMYIDDQWVLASYDYRTGALTHIFDTERIKPGKHVLRVEILDKVGNLESYSGTFTSY
ncbi:M23 family metallopeptidase [Luteibaculum oceani]|nr:M23 family metallopeptidase [Luteibaculum oceani]